MNKWKPYKLANLPAAGVYIEIKTREGDIKQNFYRCNCEQPNCMTVRGILGDSKITPVEWRLQKQKVKA